MLICGFQKTTLLDYPEHVAASVFTGGCNFRCPFCHNSELVLAAGGEGAGKNGAVKGKKDTAAGSEAAVLAFLQKRRGILQGVCITGGEPTLQTDLEDFIRQVKAMDYLVKLDTNGYRPRILQRLLEEKLVDYVAMDIKAAKEKYHEAAGLPAVDISRIEESVSLLQAADIPYEFRTTVVKGLHTVEEFAAIGKWLAGSRIYYLQKFRETGKLLGYYKNGEETGNRQSTPQKAGGSTAPEQEEKAHLEEPSLQLDTFSKEEMKKMADLAGKYIDKVVLRGVE